MTYQIEIERAALKSLVSIDKPQRRRIQARIDQLAINPRPPKAVALKGTSGDYLRIRVGTTA